MISSWIEAKVLLRLISPTWPIPLLPPPFQKTPSPHQVPNFISSPITLSSFLFQPHWSPFVPQTCHVHSSSWLLNLSVSLWGIFSLSYPHCFLPCFFQVQVYGVFPECFIEKASLYHHHHTIQAHLSYTVLFTSIAQMTMRLITYLYSLVIIAPLLPSLENRSFMEEWALLFSLMYPQSWYNAWQTIDTQQVFWNDMVILLTCY